MSIVRVPFSLTGGVAADYVPAGAIWLDGSADYLTRTPGSAGNRKTWTYSTWIKRSGLGSDQVFTPGALGSTGGGYYVQFDSSDTLTWYAYYNGSSWIGRLTPNAVYRDPTAWMNIVIVFDSTQATASDRLSLFVNGTKISSFSVESYPAQNVDGPTNNNQQHWLGCNVSTAQFYNGYLSECVMLDGYRSTDATEFGEYDTNGNWVPIDPTSVVTANKGTNGFWLDFADSADLGKDVSTSVTKVPASGSYIGDLTGGGGLAAAFNNTIDTGANGAGGYSTAATSFYLGMDHGSGVTKTITGFKIYQPSNGRIHSSASHTIQLYGSNSAPTSETDGTVLFSGTFDDTPASGGYSSYNSGITTSTAYRYHWIRFYGMSSATNSVAEFQMFEGGTDLPNSFFPISMSAANATSDRPADDADNDVGNYATWNPNSKAGMTSNATYSEGNLRASSGATGCNLQTSIAVGSGKWYCEFLVNSAASNYPLLGVSDPSIDENGWVWVGAGVRSGDGYKTDYPFDSSDAYGAAYTSGTDVVMCAMDLDNGAVWMGLNGTWWNSATSSEIAAGTTTNALSTSAEWAALGDGTPLCFGAGVYTADVTIRTKESAWSYSAPTGFKSLNTANLPAPTVTDPSAYFSIGTHTGSGSTDSYDSGLDSIGLLIAKRYDGAAGWEWFDAVRGANSLLQSNNADDAVTKTGFSFSGGTFNFDNTANLGQSGTNHVVYTLKANGAGSSNTDGSITSTVSAAAHGGFSIGTYTGTGSAATVGHGLSRAPEWVIVKMIAGTGTQTWTVFQKDIFDGASNAYIILNLPDASTSGASFSSTAPTASVFSVGNDATNQSSSTFVFYAFAKTPGLIASGKYTGNGSSTDGPYVVVDDGASGFRPKWLMVKRTDGAYDWQIVDAIRDTYNPVNKNLSANLSVAEGSGLNVDFTANGFKWRVASNSVNASGGTYIYLAFAEYPFGGEDVAQAKAR